MTWQPDNQETYSLDEVARKLFRRNKVIMADMGAQWQADCAWAFGVKGKTSSQGAGAFKIILK